MKINKQKLISPSIEIMQKLLDLYNKGFFIEAIRQAKILTKKYPKHVFAWKVLGSSLQSTNQIHKALVAKEKAVALMPNDIETQGSLINLYKSICEWKTIESDNDKLLTIFSFSSTPCFPILLMSTIEVFTLEHLYKAGKLYSNFFYNHQISLVKAIHHIHKKIRIGYLSADFYAHATVILLAGILENRNRNDFDVYIYSYGSKSISRERSRIEKACEVFRDVELLSDTEIAHQIALDEIDILIDLKGHTLNARLGIQALRPASVIVSWLGYPGTLGDERLADYIIGDSIVTPLKHAQYYSETLALMPHCYQPNDNTRPIGICPTRSQAGLPEKGFVFATFNQSYKITPEMFDIWCKLLVTVPNSVIWILEPTEIAKSNLQREMKKRGVNATRMIFAPKLNPTDHLGRLQLVDLAIDTFPCGSHTTASDALWAGVPLVTKMGETFASRVAASLLYTMDLAELVTTNDDDYFNVALSLAQNSKKMESIKQKIASQRIISPLFDTSKFARDLERLYRAIWEQELNGERKAIILNLTKDIVMKTETAKKRLNVGCGRNIMEGWLNLDLMPIKGVDIIADLDACAEIPLPLEDNTIDELLLSHVIEHIKSPLPLMQELWRIAKPDAQLVMRVPHGASDDAWEDPTHVRSYFTGSFGYFSQPFYWRADYGYRGDWRCDSITFVVSAKSNQGIEALEILSKINTQRNVVHEMIAQFTCIKPSREALKELQIAPKLNIHLA